MPHITISLPEGNTQEFIQSLSNIIHTAMVETINCPPTAMYHVVHEVKREQMKYLPEYNNIKRSEKMLMLQITLKEGRTVEQKKLMYETISSRLKAQLGIRFEDIIIVLTENKAEDWYLGRSS